jgi:translation initiation factor IF-2
MDAKINRKRTAIPAKQKNVIKLVMWTLYQVLDEETAKSKTFELLKLNESVENIIEQVDNIEKTEKYGEMETMMTAIRTNENVKKQTNVLNELSGDTDTIIKQMVEMATAEVKATVVKKPRAKKVATEATDETTETPVVEPKVKKPRAKKVATEATETTESTETTETPVVEPKAKKPRAKKVATEATETTESTETAETPVVEPKAKKPRAKKVVEPSTEATETAETVVQTTETKAKKPRAKKVATEATEPTETPVVEPKEKKPRAKKTAVVVETPVKEEVKSTEDLQEEEYLVLNEIEYEGATYMVGTDQNVYDEFNAIIGKYENEKVILN